MKEESNHGVQAICKWRPYEGRAVWLRISNFYRKKMIPSQANARRVRDKGVWHLPINSRLELPGQSQAAFVPKFSKHFPELSLFTHFQDKAVERNAAPLLEIPPAEVQGFNMYQHRGFFRNKSSELLLGS